MSMFSSSRGVRTAMPGQALPGSSWNPTSTVKPMAMPRPVNQSWNPGGSAVYNAPPAQRSENAQLASSTPAAQPPVQAPPPAPTPVVIAQDPQMMQTRASATAPMTEDQYVQQLRAKLAAGGTLNAADISQANQMFPGNPALLQAVKGAAVGMGFNYQPAAQNPLDFTSDTGFATSLQNWMAGGGVPNASTISQVSQMFPGNAALLDQVKRAAVGMGFNYAQPMAQPAPVTTTSLPPLPQRDTVRIAQPRSAAARARAARRTGNGIFTGR